MGIDNDAASQSPRQQALIWPNLPPKRRRFYVWVVALFLLAPLGAIPLQIIGLTQFWAGLLLLGLSTAILIPIALAAWQEFRHRRASGEEPSPSRVKGSIVFAWTVSAMIIWGTTVLALISRGPFVPLIPLVITAIAAIRFRRWRQQRTNAVAD